MATNLPNIDLHAGSAADVPTVVPLLPPLEAGDHLDQKTFHARYEVMPPDVRAELIGGVVYMPSPLKRPHGRHHIKVSSWLNDYEIETPGVEVCDSPTTILGEDSEPQPDCCLYLLPEKGGQLRIRDDEYLEGAPEFVAEIASSTEAYDLHSKKRDYEQAGVREYLVVALRQRNAFWFVLRDGRFQEMTPDADGIYRSEVFPGLWLDPEDLLSLNGARLRQVLRQGLDSPAHAEFVTQLAARH